MESRVRGQEREGEDDLILRDLNFPNAAFKADTILGPTWKSALIMRTAEWLLCDSVYLL